MYAQLLSDFTRGAWSGLATFGGYRKGKRGRGAAGKIAVFGLLKRGGEVRVIQPEQLDGNSLIGAIKANVELDSIVYTDSYKAYNRLSLNGFHHKRVNHGEAFSDGRCHINGILEFLGLRQAALEGVPRRLQA